MAYDEVTIGEATSPGRDITISPAWDLRTEYNEGVSYDINGDLHTTGVGRYGVVKLQVSTDTGLLSLADLNQLKEWRFGRYYLTVTDLAYAAPGINTTDAFTHIYKGYLVDIQPDEFSPRKHSITEIVLTFAIDDQTNIIIP